MSNPAPITLQQLFRYKAPWGHLPHQDAAVIELEEALRQPGATYEQVMRRDASWFRTWSHAGRQPDPDWLAPALQIIQEFEGCRLIAYRCPAGVWTIGWGATILDGRPVVHGDCITQPEADAILRNDVERYARELMRLLPIAPDWPGHRVAALTSWAFNVGLAAVNDSSLRRRLLSGEDPVKVVCDELPRWNKADGKVLDGLVRRRAAEVKLFTGPSLQQPSTPAPTPEQRREWITRVKTLNLSQPDGLTCQAACIGMAVGDADIRSIRSKLLGQGTPGDPAVMGRVIRSYGRPYQFNGDASLAQCYDWLKAGEFLITHGWFTSSGHVICLDGLELSGNHYRFNVKDPWSEFNVQTWSYDLGGKFFDGFYSALLIYATCVAGASAGHANAVYRAGKVDATRGGMWVHRFTLDQ